MGASPGGRAVVTAVLVALLTACDGPGAAGEGEEREQRSARPTAEVATPTEQPYAGWLLPNMRSLAATDLQVERVGDRRRLRFAASLGNAGAGPLLVVPGRRPACPDGQIRVRQVVYLDADGDETFRRGRDLERRRRPGGCMLDHPGHDHWHFDAMAAYTLTVPGTGIRVARDKVSFCLRDNRRGPGPRVVRRAYFGDCTPTSPQGISPGWVDVYTADLDGQWLRIPPGVDGQVACLTLEADPGDLLLESDDTDNATTVPLRIDGARVRRLPDGC